MPFTLSSDILRRLCQRNFFDVPQTGMVLFGIRGALPTNPADHEFRPQHELRQTEPDYTHVRCTMGQWLPAENTLAVFPGSTVPYINNVQRAKLAKGVGANQLMTGYYPFYQRRPHVPVTPANAHDAFGLSQGALSAIRRTTDDLDFDTSDSLEVSNPHDNIHAAYGMNMDGHYSSSGCQVVLGFPKCTSTTFRPEGGPWKTFKANAYGRADQKTFPYVLLDAREAAALSDAPAEALPARLRFGSSGETVRALQGALKVTQSGTFDEETLRAVLKYQQDEFGLIEATGVVGPRTVEKFGIEWPAFPA